jgi:hypothetical protein
MNDPSLRSRTSFNPSQLNRIDTTRLAAYKTNLDFYNGSQWQQTSRNRQLVFNYAKVTSFLTQGSGSACHPVVGEGLVPSQELKTKTRRAEYVLRQAYDQNNLQQLDYETEIDAAVLGDACYKVTWDTDDKPVRITAPDVLGIFAWWLGDDTSRVWRVASRYTLTKDEVEVLYSDVIASPSPSVILSEAKNLSGLRVNSAWQSRHPHQRRPGALRCHHRHRPPLRDRPGEIPSTCHPDRLRPPPEPVRPAPHPRSTVKWGRLYFLILLRME